MEWLSHLIPGNAPDGAPILSILGKKTYKFENGKIAVADDKQESFIEADEYYGKGKPQNDPIKLEFVIQSD